MPRGIYRLYVTHSSIEASAYARGGAREMEEHGMVISAVDIVEWGTVIFDRARTKTRVPDAGACIISADIDRCGFHGNGCERLTKLPAVWVWESRRIQVGRDLNPCAHVAENGGRLENRDAVSGVCERMGRSETGNACGDDYDIETEPSAASVVEWRDFV